MQQFVEDLIQEIQLRTAALEQNQRTFSTLFFGGGTPSLLTPAQLEQILTALQAVVQFTPDAEWTMECNPGTISLQSLIHYRSLGINRLSFGVQSFFFDDLHFLSRIHSPQEALSAIFMAKEAGFENVNLDLMFSLPGQSLERWQQNLRQAVELQTDHISAYSLIFEEGTPLFTQKLRGEVRENSEDDDARFFEWTMEFLEKHSFVHYEVSNFARNGKECRHNVIYWSGNEYLAFGPSAHGYLCQKDTHERYWNVRSLHRYHALLHNHTLPITNSEQLSIQERMFERIFLELRSRGIDLKRFQSDFGIPIHKILQPIVQRYTNDGFFHHKSDRLSLTKKGFLLCDSLTTEIITSVEVYSGITWGSFEQNRQVSEG